ncbi:molybdate ABC transporter substrate-binding protein [Dokdonella sp.]|uniref:molybdate ABC transporter substrate-binding protein n=3 Tax=Dokdonella sp. TaxID=2291710 RepID=UPI0025C3F596|nr:molybdate ABC transporter substrate-binding protein [Dokdonella sp.]
MTPGHPCRLPARARLVRRRSSVLASLLGCVVMVLATAGTVRAAELLVFAAASLKPALDTIIAQPQAHAIGQIEVSYAASSQLARQIEHGAPAALFISADEDWMNHVEATGRIVAGTRRNLLGNALVLIGPAQGNVQLRIEQGFDLAGALGGDGRLAIATPDSVPAGKYSKAALISLGVWDSVASRLAPAAHVRAALRFVASAETPLGIVYRSDAVSEPRVRVVDTFPQSSHAPIIYPIAAIQGDDVESARHLLDLLESAQAGAVFQRCGFDSLTP